MNLKKLAFWTTLFTTSAVPLATAQNPVILQGNYVSNVFGQSNFVLNPNAQTNVANVTVSSATVTRSATTPLVATSEFNITTSTATGYADWATRTFDAGMKNQNCEARFTYRGFSVGSTKAQLIQNSLVVAELTLTASTSDPRIASINFPCGDLTYATTFRLQQATASLTGTNEIGGIYVGLATNQANVAQAEFVGATEFQNCATTHTVTSTTFASFNSPSCTRNNFGAATTTTNDLSITIPNAKPGWYFVKFNGIPFSSAGSNANCYWSIKEDVSNYIGGGAYSHSPASFGAATGGSQLTSDLNVTTSGSRTWRVVAKSSSGSCNVDVTNVINSTLISVYRFPSSSELVVTPERQNTYGSIGGTGIDYSTKSTSFVTPSGFTVDTNPKGKCLADGTNVACKISTLPPGNYNVTITAPMTSAGDTTSLQVCHWGISDGINTDISLANTIANTGSGTYETISQISRPFTYTSVQTNIIFKLIVKQANNGGASATCGMGTSGNRYWIVTVTPLDQPSNSALYVQGPVKAAGTGDAIASGYVGEIRSFRSTGCGTNNAYNGGASLTVTPGVWRITGTATLEGGGTITDFLLTVGAAAGATTFRQSFYNDSWWTNITVQKLPIVMTPYLIRFDGSTMYYFDNGSWAFPTASSGGVYLTFFRNSTTCAQVYSMIQAERVN